MLVRQRRGGISRYVVELYRAFASDPSLGVEPVPGWWLAPNEHAREAGLAPPDPLPTGLQGRCWELPYDLLNARARARAASADVLHHTYYDPRYLRTPVRGPRVVTVYDMTPELLPEQFDSNPHLAKREYVERADLVLCVSESTREDLGAVYGALDAPVIVTHLGVDPGFHPLGAQASDLPSSFVLHVGTRTGYKDFPVLAEAFARANSGIDALVAVGGGPFSDEERTTFAALGMGDRAQQIDVSDQGLATVYRSAALLVAPSRYEGFGLPAVEAMASGCPVVLADSSSLPEVGGSAARYFPPGDVEALVAVLEDLARDTGARAAMREVGLAQAARFSWAATARETAEAYELVG